MVFIRAGLIPRHSSTTTDGGGFQKLQFLDSFLRFRCDVEN